MGALGASGEEDAELGDVWGSRSVAHLSSGSSDVRERIAKKLQALRP